MSRITKLPRVNFSYVSLGNAWKRLHARQGNQPSRAPFSEVGYLFAHLKKEECTDSQTRLYKGVREGGEASEPINSG